MGLKANSIFREFCDKYKIIKLQANFVHFIALLTDIKQTYYLVAYVINSSRIIIKLTAKY